MPSPVGGRETTMYFWTLPGPDGAVLGGAVVAVETSLTMGCTLGTVVVTGEVVVEPEPGAEVLRDRTWGREGKALPGGAWRLLPARARCSGTSGHGLVGLLRVPLPALVFGPRGNWALLWGPQGTWR